ncbi:hypothetical protein WR25_05158 [Diploscapter pachys]|uniref:Transient receptor ion channel domain-containing protein n=1 Tax=Diploscapter pachys TaxID=2018661 RepID=A0A2A2JZM7_9BILA|nr:hypothetical protein WR25_05158 [Diploscapter pachys]
MVVLLPTTRALSSPPAPTQSKGVKKCCPASSRVLNSPVQRFTSCFGIYQSAANNLSTSMLNVVRGIHRHRRSPKVTEDDLKQFKAPEFSQKDEGYDGRLVWDQEDEKSAGALLSFQIAVEGGDRDKIKELIGSITTIPESSQLEHFIDLLIGFQTLDNLKEALLTAICIGNRPLVEMVLGLFAYTPFDERSGCAWSAAFPPHVTPLLLACNMNNLAIVECLLLRGHQLDIPHMRKCECELCLKMSPSSRNDIRAVDTIRAMCSDAYLWLATHDPFAAACALAEDVQERADEDNYRFKDQYQAMLSTIDHFLCRFVDCAWSTDEMRIVLERRPYCPVSSCEMPLPRVQLAMSAGIKHVISTPNIQDAMLTTWLGDWCQFGAGRPRRDAYRLMRHVLFYPIMALLFIFTNGKIAKSFNVPFAKYISHCAAYGTFIISLIVIRYFKQGNVSNILEKSFEAYFFSYVLGMLLERYIMLSRIGPQQYLMFWWRWFDGVLIFMFGLTTAIWIGHWVEQKQDFEQITHLENLNFSSIYDILLGICCILSITKVFYFMQLMKGLGGTVISVGKCVGTVYNYLLIMFLVMVSFAIGLNLVQQPFSHRLQVVGDKNTTTQGAYEGITYSVRSLFWGFYGYLSPSDYDIAVGNSGPNYEVVNYDVTRYTLEMITALYHIMLVLMLLNLMISLLVKKADEVLENEDTEYKYTRVAIYSEYISWESTIPPPFNLICIPISGLMKMCYDKENHSLHWPEIFLRDDCSPFDDDEKARQTEREASYTDLLITMFARYRASREVHFRSACYSDIDKGQKDSPPKVYFLSDELKIGKTGKKNERISMPF